MEIEVVHSKSGKSLGTLYDLSNSSTILDVKKAYRGLKPNLYPERQAFKLDPKGKVLKDTETLEGLGLSKGSKLFFKDLGPQLGWTTVFLTEYTGPLIVYLMFYLRPEIVYGEAAREPKAPVVHIAAACWTFHYAKRLLETLFVHRFSHATMPVFNIFKNSSYYWGFAGYVSYYVNHPLYTPPTFGTYQIYLGLAAFVFCELGNLSIHVALRNLRPPGTKERNIPYPSSNPFTLMFNFVSCPNYTYEIGSWISFSVMTQCFAGVLFTLAGFYQMTVWALGKHRNYKREFKSYPRGRKSIVPFII